jgi:4-amino-4-deoxy-L-arabinose transferase-like glycosyltransferase
MVYEYPTNYSNGTSATGPGGFFLDWTTSVIPQLGGGIILLIWLSVFGVSAAFGSRKSILVSSFITSIFAVFFAVRGWINLVIPFTLILVTAFALIFGGSDSGGGI